MTSRRVFPNYAPRLTLELLQERVLADDELANPQGESYLGRLPENLFTVWSLLDREEA